MNYNIFIIFLITGGGAGPPAPPRGRGRGPMTREEAQRLREEELAGQGHGKDCFIIPQANLDRFLPDGVTVSVLSTFTLWSLMSWRLMLPHSVQTGPKSKLFNFLIWKISSFYNSNDLSQMPIVKTNPECGHGPGVLILFSI